MVPPKKSLRGVILTGCLAAILAPHLALGESLPSLPKVAGAALTPTGLLWLLLAALAGILWHRRQRSLAMVTGACWLLFSLAGQPHLAAWQFALLEGTFSRPRPSEGVHLDALLVLGGGMAVSSKGVGSLTEAAERVVWPVQLHRRGVADILVSSGPHLPTAPPPGTSGLKSYPEVVAHLWMDLGVPKEHIVLLAGAKNTREEIEALRRLVAQRGWRRVGLVTSAWHMRRALRHCQRVGLEVHPFPCDWRSHPPIWRWSHLVPQASALAASSVVWSEALALLAGR